MKNYLDLEWQIPVRGDWRLSTPSHIKSQEPRTLLDLPGTKTELDAQVRAESLIYVVDDEPHLTELYESVLEAAGFPVKSFNDRTEALAALNTATRRPRLLILDYLGHPISAERFIERFRQIHPFVRILMASGMDASQLLSARAKPDHFIQKPFTADSFLAAVRVALK